MREKEEDKSKGHTGGRRNERVVLSRMLLGLVCDDDFGCLISCAGDRRGRARELIGACARLLVYPILVKCMVFPRTYWGEIAMNQGTSCV